jgi:hypothetical protein
MTCEPCKICDNLPVNGVEAELQCGETLQVQTTSHICLEELTLEYSCPMRPSGDWELNFPLSDHWGSSAAVTFKPSLPASTRQADLSLVSGSFNVHCRVCDLNSFELEDMDGRAGHARVVVEFGQLIVHKSDLGESVIDGYAVFGIQGNVSEVGELPRLFLEDALAVVNKSGSNRRLTAEVSSDCGCDPTEYSVEVEAALPSTGPGLRLMVAPILPGGEVLPVGVATDPIMDYIVTTTEHTTTMTSVTDSETSSISVTSASETSVSETSSATGTTGTSVTATSATQTTATSLTTVSETSSTSLTSGTATSSSLSSSTSTMTTRQTTGSETSST